MKFIVEKEIFEKLPNACFGIVMAKGIDNSKEYKEITKLLDENIEEVSKRFANKKVKEEKEIIPYREAFLALNINPNKYLCSIEALFTRIAKGKGIPHINSIVDLGNAISLKYTLPIGAHDLGNGNEDICIRFAKKGDTFLPFGSENEEVPDIGEVVYAVGNQVRTRRWTWRQSEHGKITPSSTNIFFPIDGFVNFNKEQVIAARDELASYLKKVFNCQVQVGFVDISNLKIEI